MHWLSFAGITFMALFPLVNPIGALPLFATLTQTASPDQRKRLARRTAVYLFLILAVTEYIGHGILQLFGLSLGMLQIAGGLIVAHTAWDMSTGAPRVSPGEQREIEGRLFRDMKEKTVAAVTQAASSVATAASSAEAAIKDLPQRMARTSPGDPDDDENPADLEDEAGGESSPPGGRENASAAPDGGDRFFGELAEPPQAPERDSEEIRDISFTPMAMPMLAGPGSMGIVIGLVAQNQGLLDSLGIALGILGISLLALVCLLATTPIIRAMGPSGILALQRIFGFITLGIAVALISTGISALFGLQLHGAT